VSDEDELDKPYVVWRLITVHGMTRFYLKDVWQPQGGRGRARLTEHLSKACRFKTHEEAERAGRWLDCAPQYRRVQRITKAHLALAELAQVD